MAGRGLGQLFARKSIEQMQAEGKAKELKGEARQAANK